MITELVISGGSAKGLAFSACLKYLEEVKLLDISKLKKVVGVSIGSFVLASYLIGYSIDEFLDLMLHADIPSFKDISGSSSSIAILKGSVFRAWVREIISKKIDPDITMLSFYKTSNIEFIIGTTCLEDGLIYISYKNRPNMKLIDALICSMNFPFVFPPYEVPDENGHIKKYIDGGLIDNFPLHLVGPDAIGITSKGSPKTTEDLSIYSYMVLLFDLMKTHMDILTPHETEYVYRIDLTDKSKINFDIDIDDKLTIFMEGYYFTKNSDITKKLLEKMSTEKITLDFNKVLHSIKNYPNNNKLKKIIK